MRMDDALRDKIRRLAEDNDIDPERLEASFSGASMPEALEKTVATVLGDVELFDLALRKLKSPEK